MVTYEEYDQHNDEKDNPDVKKKLGIRIVDLVQQGLGQVELEFILKYNFSTVPETNRDPQLLKLGSNRDPTFCEIRTQ